MSEWSVQLGATLARLRCNLLRCQQADACHSETYRIVTGLPLIDYRETDNSVKQVYVLNGRHAGFAPKLRVDGQSLKPDDQVDWFVAQSVGKFGHPLVRAFVSRGLG